MTQKKPTIVFFGTPDFAVPVLKALIEKGYPPIAVVTIPDQPIGRKQILTPSPVKLAAQEHSVPVLQPATLKDEQFLAEFKNLNPDICIVVAYGKIIPQDYLSIPRYGFINIHPSLLPTYRGPSPVRTAILDGVTQSGVSIILLDQEMDHGPILAQQPWAISADMDAQAAEKEAFRIGGDLLLRTLPDIVAGTLVPQPQDHTQATVTKKFTREDGHLDWSQPAQSILNRIRALADNPGTWTTTNGKILNILHAHLADGKLILDTVQPEGGKPMDWNSFLNGHPGTILQ